MKGGWNHNIHYHNVVLQQVIKNCGKALDAGCGEGFLARQLSQICTEVVGIDLDGEVLSAAVNNSRDFNNIHFVKGNVLDYPFPEKNFDFIASVSTLHHMPLKQALNRFSFLLKPGGVLVIVGLYRMQTLADYIIAAVAIPASKVISWFSNKINMNAPIALPKETVKEIRKTAILSLPGVNIKRRLLFRYTLIWRKPGNEKN